MATFEPPAPVRDILARIDVVRRTHGLDGYVVGGTVRDTLLGRPLRDIDIAVGGDAFAFARRLAEVLGGHFVPLDDANGVARVVIVAGPVMHVDIAALQGDLHADLRRRDLTIDALAAPLTGGDVIDVTSGIADLRTKTIRMNSPGAFEADALRLLRAARLAAELGFTIESETVGAIRVGAVRISHAAAERRRDELARIFALDRVEPALRLLDDLDLLDVLVPEVAGGRGVTQPENHHAFDVFEHAMHAVEAIDLMLAPIRPESPRVWIWDEVWQAFAWCEQELRAYLLEEMSEGRTRASVLKLATFLHDVAKPETRTVDSSGRIRFLGHAERGAGTAASIMRRLRFSARETAFVRTLVAQHLRPVQLAAVGEVPTMRAIYRFHRDLREAAPAVLLLALADAAGSRGPMMTREAWAHHARYMNSLLVRLREAEGIVRAPRLLTGHDIMMEFGLSEGPLVGRLLEDLREAQATGEVHGREAALAFVRSRLQAGEGT